MCTVRFGHEAAVRVILGKGMYSQSGGSRDLSGRPFLSNTFFSSFTVYLHILTHLIHLTSMQLIREQTVRYRGADKSLARPTSRCDLFDGENISFDASLLIYIYVYIYIYIPPIMVINTMYEKYILGC